MWGFEEVYEASYLYTCTCMQIAKPWESDGVNIYYTELFTEFCTRNSCLCVACYWNTFTCMYSHSYYHGHVHVVSKGNKYRTAIAESL